MAVAARFRVARVSVRTIRSAGLTSEQVRVTASKCPKTLTRNALGVGDSATSPPS